MIPVYVVQMYLLVTDGWSVYPGCIPLGDQIISKTYMNESWGGKHSFTSLFGASTS